MKIKHESLPLVSVITPFLNVEKYFHECIESVLIQEYENWELFLIDDGSTDKSTEIAKGYALKYPGKIFYLEHENHQNKGASASRNLGIKASNGEYIAFLDSDDIYLSSKLRDQVPLLNANPEAGMLYSSTERWYSWTGLKEDQCKDKVWKNFGVEPNHLIKPPQLLLTFLKDGSTVPCMGSVLARRKAIDSVGGWENTFTHIYTDQVFHAKICLDWLVYVSDGCWDKYRQHPNSSYQKVKRNKNAAYIARSNYLKWLEKYLIQKKINKTNPELWKAHKNAIFPYKYKYSKELSLALKTAKKIYNRIIS